MMVLAMLVVVMLLGLVASGVTIVRLQRRVRTLEQPQAYAPRAVPPTVDTMTLYLYDHIYDPPVFEIALHQQDRAPASYTYAGTTYVYWQALRRPRAYAYRKR